MLSDPEFPAFAAKVVPFLHVTTRIADRKHEGLLSEKGFGGFPSLAFMDAQGEVVGKPQGRTVEAFQKTLAALESRADLAKRIEAGETGLELELLFVEHTLGAITPEDFAARAEDCENLTADQQARIDQILVDNEISQWAGAARRGGPGLETAGATFLQMLDDGKRPSSDLRYSGGFWSVLARWAPSQSDSALARRIAKEMRKDMAEHAAFVKMADELDKTADNLDELTALRGRIEDGAEGLEADVLVREYDLGETVGTEFSEQAEALLEGATAEQKAALESRLLELEFLGHLEFSRDPAVRTTSAKALLELLGDDGQPPEKLAGRVWQSLIGHGRQTQDPDLMERALEGMKQAYAGEAALAGFVKNMEKAIEEMREKNASGGDTEGGDG